MRRNLKSILKQLGYKVVGEASNGREATELYKQLLPDVVTMDITMPDMNGIEAVEEIIKDHPDANIIMISALNQRRMVYTAINKGAKYYLIKPFKISMVSKALEEVFKARGKNEQQEAKELKPTSGYLVSNIEGSIYIQIYTVLNKTQSLELNATLKGLMEIPNIKITFDLSACSDYEQFLSTVKGFKNQIEEKGGQAKIIQ